MFRGIVIETFTVRFVDLLILLTKPFHGFQEHDNKERLQFQIENQTFHLLLDKLHIHKDRKSF